MSSMITVLYVLIGLFLYDFLKQCRIQFIWRAGFVWAETKPHPDGPMFLDIETGRKFKTTQFGTITLVYKTFRRTYILYKYRREVANAPSK